MRLLKILVAILFLSGLIFWIDVKAVWSALSELTFEAFFYLLVVSGVLIWISCLKWKLFLELYTKDISVDRLFSLYLVGYFVNLALPSYVGGDVVRSWYVGKRVGQHEALAATILERYTGVVAMMLLGLLALFYVKIVTWQIIALLVGMSLCLLVLSIFAVSDSMLKIVSTLPYVSFSTKHLTKIREALLFAKSHPSLLLKAMVLSFLYHCFTVVNTLAAAYAVGWDNAPVQDLFVVLPLILLVGALPFTPSGLGLQEGAFFIFLSTIGATHAQAIGVGIVLRAKIILLSLLGGVFWLFLRKEKEAQSTSIPDSLL